MLSPAKVRAILLEGVCEELRCWRNVPLWKGDAGQLIQGETMSAALLVEVVRCVGLLAKGDWDTYAPDTVERLEVVDVDVIEEGKAQGSGWDSDRRVCRFCCRAMSFVVLQRPEMLSRLLSHEAYWDPTSPDAEVVNLLLSFPDRIAI